MDTITTGVVMIVLTVVAGCMPNIKRADVPMRTISYPGPPESAPNSLFIFLPGRGDDPEAFERHGFIRAVRNTGLPFDMTAVDAHPGYYHEGTVVRRLTEDVIEPAKATGYTKIWLVGISLGALGALAYANESRDAAVAGMVLLGPYLGEQPVADAIRRAGGLSRWSPARNDGRDWEERLWDFLRQFAFRPEAMPPLYLGYGKDDRYAYGAALLSTVLPPDRVFAREGGHAWGVWSQIWVDILAHIRRSQEHGRTVGK